MAIRLWELLGEEFLLELWELLGEGFTPQFWELMVSMPLWIPEE